MPRFKLARHVGPSVAASVTYDTTIGNGVDGSGFANLPLRAGAKRFFVNSTTGSDTNTSTQAQSPSTPVATLSQALTFVTSGQGDQVLIAEGTTYSASFASPRGKYGFSATYPTVIQSYDPADALNEAKYGRATTNRPTFTATGLQEIGTGGGGGQPIRYFAMRGLKFNPASASGNSFSMLGTPNGKNEFILIENNIFANMQVVFDQYDIYVDPITRDAGWVIRGNAIYGGWHATDHAQGLYMSGTIYTLEDNVLYHGGWKLGALRQDNISVGGLVGDAVFRHNAYIQENSGGISRRNLSIDGAADGGQYRGDVLLFGNIQIDNPIGVGVGGGDQYETIRPKGVSIEAAYNVLLGSQTIDNSSTPGDAWMMSSANGKSGSSWHHNIGAHAQALNGRVFDTTAASDVDSYMDYADNVTYQVVTGNSTVNTPGGTIWEEGTYAATRIHTSYARNKWDNPTSGTNVNVGSVSFSNAYTADQIYQALGFTGADAATRKQAFVTYVIAHPEDHTIQQQFYALALAGYGITAPSTDATPTLSSASGTATGTTTANLSFGTTGSNGIAYWVVTTSSTPPTADQVSSKCDASGALATAADTIRVTASGTQSMAATGLASATGYYLHVIHQPFNGTRSAVVSSSLFTTS